MNGEEFVEMLVAELIVLVRGDGVRGIRPPAVFDEKRPWWLLIGVDTDGVAIVNVMIEWTN